MSLLMEAHIVVFIFFVIAAIMTPPDVVSQITLAVPMIIVYFILKLIVSRQKSYAQTLPRTLRS